MKDEFCEKFSAERCIVRYVYFLNRASKVIVKVTSDIQNAGVRKVLALLADSLAFFAVGST